MVSVARRQPKHQTKEKQFLDDIIDSVTEEQQRTMEYIEPDKEDKGLVVLSGIHTSTTTNRSPIFLKKMLCTL